MSTEFWANEFSLDFTDEEIIQHAKWKKLSEDDFVEMNVKSKISNPDSKESFYALYMQHILLLKNLEHTVKINYLNKVNPNKITLYFNKS